MWLAFPSAYGIYIVRQTFLGISGLVVTLKLAHSGLALIEEPFAAWTGDTRRDVRAGLTGDNWKFLVSPRTDRRHHARV